MYSLSASVLGFSTTFSRWHFVSTTTFVQDLGLTNLRQGAGILPSWSRVVPWLSAIPIDHCLIGDDLQGFAFGLLPIPGSDHDAVRAVVGFTAD